MKVEALGMYFVIEVPHATLWIPNARLWCLLLDSSSSSPSPAAAAAHLKFDKALGGRRFPSEVTHILRYTLLSAFSFMQTGSNLYSGLLFTQHCTETQSDKSSGSCATMWCIWLQGNRRIYQDLWISSLFFMQPWCRVVLHKKLLIKHCVGPSWSDSVCHNSWDVKLIFMLSKMCWCLRPSCCPPLNFPPHLHTSFLGWWRSFWREQKSMLWSDFYQQSSFFYC